MTAYFRELSKQVGRVWNRFWFTPRDPFTLSVLRIAVGLMAIFYIVSHSADLVHWFAADGILPGETAQRLAGAEQSRYFFHYSYLYFANTAVGLWTLHVLGLVVLVAFTAGLCTRVTSVLAVVVALSYVHRAPMITAQFEPVLTMLLIYLCLAPTGRYLSVDRWLRQRKTGSSGLSAAGDEQSVMATICTRLIQLHLAALYLMIGLNMLSAETWWTGEATWWLMARSESRLVDLTGLASHMMLVNLWTHLVVAYQFSFGLLIWPRLLRPILLVLGPLVWLPLALVTGTLAYAAVMLVASVVFVEPGHWPRRQVRHPE
jgi:hypothetical protein